ncbi:dipeptidase [Fluviicola sp.]|jgi:acetylornithine deacetylase/succinyl-diaminopimelate desuccinylase-like protein|uniref:dipeptidase n=1 Tax=Fluviicola sp. TaxID=1917219 RepID=UPI0028307F72|nr:dipeptidase [Fluviicola sp.]MDR0802273.1 dipeptidase [Fluviicola sp.]
MQKTQIYIQESKDRFLQELIELLKIPTISADSAYAQEVIRGAEKVAEFLVNAGAENVEICKTAGHPIVFGEKIIHANAPTVLVYGHYDVQPADPVDLWTSPPFEPVVKKTDIHPDGAIFARGACDDKGQFFMHVKAFEAMMKSNELPCNVKFMIEGEEEVGSENLGVFVRENKERLKADIILVSDTGMLANDTPSITTGLRGLSYVEVEVTGPNRDLHSGLYGGCVANPINILTKMIASLHDENNHITIPGFYADVVELSLEERAEMAKAPYSEENYKKALNIDAVYGETGYTTPERGSIRPTLDVNGIWGGYTGEGAKTVIASKAHAKISMRLVPDQEPGKITQLFKNHFESIAPAGIKVVVNPHHGGEPVVTPIDSIAYKSAAKAYEKTFGKVPIPVRSGGSIPIIALFEQELGLKTVMMGFGLDSDAIHSPNEHYGLFNFYKGIETIPYFFHYFNEAMS